MASMLDFPIDIMMLSPSPVNYSTRRVAGQRWNPV
jgi:hypothetical protein